MSTRSSDRQSSFLGSSPFGSRATPPSPSTPSTPFSRTLEELQKRKRSAEELESSKQPRVDQGGPFVAAGKHFGRVVALFGSIEPILRDGRRHAELSMNDVNDLEDEQLQENIRMFRNLVKFCPDVETKLQSRAEGVLPELAAKLDVARSQGRSDDTSNCKALALDILRVIEGGEAVVGLHPKSKTERGYNHVLTGRYLCPIELFEEWEDETSDVRTLLQQSKAIIRGATDEPVEIDTSDKAYEVFMYKDCKVDANRLFVGFMENEFLFWLGLGIFISPTAATAPAVNGNKSSKPGNAGKHSMTEVTVPALAYIAMQARLALSSDEQFSAQGQGNFCYHNFYDTIVLILQSEAFRPLLLPLLEKWNMRLFPAETKAKHAAKRSTAGSTAKMLQQLGKENHRPRSQ